MFSGLLVVGGVIGTSLVFLTDRDPRGAGVDATSSTPRCRRSSERASAARNSTSTCPAWVDGILGVVGSGLLVITVWVLFRPGRRRAVLTPDEELPARALLAEWGERDSLGYFAHPPRQGGDLLPHRQGRRSPTASWLGVSLASGDPIGDPEAWPPAIEAWLRRGRGVRLDARR